jgi:hypothetical protein
MMEHRSQNLKPLALGLTVLGAVARFLPHPPNFTPVGSVSLFAGARLPRWQAYLVPLILMALSDVFLTFSPATPFVYASFLISVWIGRRLRSTQSAGRVAAAALASSAQFFLISNFGTWAATAYYPHTVAGLAACYTAAIPFFAYTIAGDLFYTAALFGLYALLTRRAFPAERVAAA